MEKLFFYAAQMLHSTLEYEELMRQILQLTLDATDAEAAMVYRMDPDVEKVRARFRRREDETLQYFKLPKGKGIVGWTAEEKKPVIVNDVTTDERFLKDFEDIVGLRFHSVLMVPLFGRGQLIGVIEAINKQSGSFTGDDLDILTALSSPCAVAIDNANLFRETRRVARERQLLFEVGKKLSSSLDVDSLLKLILDSVRDVIGFNAGGIYLLEADTESLYTVYAEGYCDEEGLDVALKFGQGLVGWVAKTGEPLIVPDVRESKIYVNCHHETRSEIVVPLKIEERVLGVMNLESNRTAAYDESNLELLTALASQAAISVERAVLHEKMLSGQQIQAQLSVARQIQLTFLPKRDPQLAGYDISGINIPSGEVGGDYFDFIHIIDQHTGIAIADVSGKGIPASLIMAAFRASLIAEIRNNFTISTICGKVNRLLTESLEEGNFVTAFYGVLDSRNHVLTFANCGHNYPVWLRTDDTVCHLTEGGLPLGFSDTSLYEERPVSILPGDLILFYTDGVTETADTHGEEFGQERLLAALRRCRDLPAREIHRRIYDEVRNFAGEGHVFDDLTMIVLKRE
jgi:sigma-B regulation protein RsbU (phosphoserine phosphatase)